MFEQIHRRQALAGLGALTAGVVGCQKASTDEPQARSGSRASGDEVTVYTALDEEFSKPILRIYSQKTGVRVRPAFDVESTKSFGLAGRIIAEASAPLCDLFWNNEILNTLRLKHRGLLAPFQPKGYDAVPAAFRDPDGTWYGLAARARILIVNTQVVQEADRPKRLSDLLEPLWKGKIGMAKPLFGTTGTHAACLFAAWGEAQAKQFFDKLKANDVLVLSGNRQVAAEVAAGRLAIGLTDTDDALLEVNAGNPVSIVYPDRGREELGTLFIPNTISRIKGCRHPDAADALASYILSPEVEKALALGPSGQIPLNPAVDAKLQVETPKTVKAMEVDLDKAASLWEGTVAPFLTQTFAGA